MWFAIWLYVILIFPISLSVKIFYLQGKNKLFYSLSLFNAINLNSGYFLFKEDLVSININSARSILIPYAEIFAFRDNIKLINDFNIMKLFVRLEYSIIDNLEINLIKKFFSEFILNELFRIVKNEKSYIRLFFSTSLEQSISNQVFVKCNLFLNIFLILINFIKIFVERLFNGFKRTKQNKYSISNDV